MLQNGIQDAQHPHHPPLLARFGSLYVSSCHSPSGPTGRASECAGGVTRSVKNNVHILEPRAHFAPAEILARHVDITIIIVVVVVIVIVVVRIISITIIARRLRSPLVVIVLLLISSSSFFSSL